MISPSHQQLLMREILSGIQVKGYWVKPDGMQETVWKSELAAQTVRDNCGPHSTTVHELVSLAEVEAAVLAYILKTSGI